MQDVYNSRSAHVFEENTALTFAPISCSETPLVAYVPRATSNAARARVRGFRTYVEGYAAFQVDLAQVPAASPAESNHQRLETSMTTFNCTTREPNSKIRVATKRQRHEVASRAAAFGRDEFLSDSFAARLKLAIDDLPRPCRFPSVAPLMRRGNIVEPFLLH